ncbi:hypothetical protein PV10_01650 [Exophiala mesophila]|uniref:Uncharacterized protein n=1 Tax=Exophiala mesophila TaxID=212818 RepID=A0A0D1X7V3_EXOME|nr:uncharacterized protein PV10_01650 [Exophiala mesophila]KIV97955.1 hypothetical protein PV10_01650 [Exophiala mesophila]
MGSYTPEQPLDGGFPIMEEPMGTARHIKIITIGAGVSGLNMIRRLRKSLINYEHTVYEKNPEVGGTWFENTYPGCQCDHPSHNYQFSWRTNPAWSQFSAPSSEIEAYLYDLCDAENMRPEIKLSHQVSHAQWIEASGKWELEILNLKTGEMVLDSCHFLLNATGVLNNWKWPDIPGLKDFKGDLVHSAAWSKDFDYHNKRVAVIGNGSSGVQIVPALQPDVTNLFHFVRSPTWILPPQTDRLLTKSSVEILRGAVMDGSKFTQQQIQRFRDDPIYYKSFIKATEEQVNGLFRVLVDNEGLAKDLTVTLTENMSATLKHDPKLIKAIIPTFTAGCRRLTPGPGYLESLTASNVSVITDKIVRVVPEGIITSTGELIEVNAIVCATGFDVSFRPRFPIIGRNGNLQDIWAKQLPAAYMSCAVAHMPNYFLFMGPNSPAGHGSIMTIAEQVARYIVVVLKKWQTECIVSVAPKEAAVNEFAGFAHAFLPRTVWAGACRSWYKNGTIDGPIIALHAGSRIHWFHMMENFRGEDYEYTYDSANRFRYLGNGFSVRETGDNPTWYLDNPDPLNEAEHPCY